MMGFWRTAVLLLCPLFLSVTSDVIRSSYRAAVYEHVIIFPTEFQKAVSRTRALKTMNKNLDVYEVQANKARRQEANILVFPEDGIYGMIFSRDALYPYLESIPDPDNIKWSPCADPTRFPSSEVQHRLSCMAMNNKMYIAANMGDKIACNKLKDPKCPNDGRYQYNTAVVYDPEGTLVAKYHKRHLFYESQFDEPEVEIKFFDTPFGRFGLVVCFDLLFHDPAVAMVMRHNVTNVLFPTAWRDALPLLSAIGYHSSFARGLGVNLLVSNVHFPLLRFHGSGVYTPKGMASFYYDNRVMSSGKLLVTQIDILREPVATKLASTHHFNSEVSTASLNYLNENWLSEEDEFFADVFHDRFRFRALRETSGEIRVCDRGACCHLKYEIAEGNDHNLFRDLFAFGVFDGLHTYQGQYYLQVCTLMKCASRVLKSLCGATTFVSSTMFKSLYIRAEFQTGYVYPQVVLSSNGQLELAPADQWDFSASANSTNETRGDEGGVYNFVMSSSSSGFPKPLLSATLFGRYYARDNDTIASSQDIHNIIQNDSKKSRVFSSLSDILSYWFKILKRFFAF